MVPSQRDHPGLQWNRPAPQRLGSQVEAVFIIHLSASADTDPFYMLTYELQTLHEYIDLYFGKY